MTKMVFFCPNRQRIPLTVSSEARIPRSDPAEYIPFGHCSQTQLWPGDLFTFCSAIKEERIMNGLWTYIDNKNWTVKTKYLAILSILSAISGIIGIIIWLIVRIRFFSTPDWIICFIGYPIIISWIVVIIYSCRHDFHNGDPDL